jgi:hypothetical protein
MDFLNVKSQILELPVIAGTTLAQFKFPTQDFLRQKYIISIEAYNASDVPFAPSGNAVITAANLSNSFLQLYGQNPEAVDAQGIKSSGDGQWMDNIPLVSLHRTINGTPSPYVRDLFGMVPRTIIWEKSFVNLANGQVLGNETAISYLFLIGYIGNAGDAKG